jgi:hypothetical protein
LSKYPALNNFEKQTSVPKVYAILGLGALYFFLIFFNIAGEFLVNIAGFIIPGYYSLSALFSASKIDDTQVRTLEYAAIGAEISCPTHANPTAVADCKTPNAFSAYEIAILFCIVYNSTWLTQQYSTGWCIPS